MSQSFFSSATRDIANGKFYIKLVNASDQSQPLNIDLKGAGKLGPSATLITLHGTNPAATNTIDDDKRIVPAKSKVLVSAKFRHTMPPYSVQALAIDSRLE